MIESYSDEERDEVMSLHETSLISTNLYSYEPLSPLSYIDSQVWVGETPIYISGNSETILLCLHGLGHSGLSFACLSKLLKPFFRLVSFDYRFHGSNTNTQGDLHIDSLIEDTLEILGWVRNNFEAEKIVLLGHSMGGAVAAKVALEDEKRGNKLCGVILVDAMERRTMLNINLMEKIVNDRPMCFSSDKHAIQWALRSRYITNRESARISMPSQVSVREGKCQFVIDLRDTRPFWEGWFSGMNEAFLSICTRKLIVLGSDNYTDELLKIGAHQGKLKEVVINNAGHTIHENEPLKLAEELKKFIFSL